MIPTIGSDLPVGAATPPLPFPDAQLHLRPPLYESRARLLEHAQAFVPVQDGLIHIEKINGPFLFGDKATPSEYSAGPKICIDHGRLELHESGTFVRLSRPVPSCCPEG